MQIYQIIAREFYVMIRKSFHQIFQIIEHAGLPHMQSSISRGGRVVWDIIHAKRRYKMMTRWEIVQFF